MEGAIRLTGLWKGVTKNGNRYLSGSLGSAKLLIFENQMKRGTKDPDYTAFLVSNKREGENSEETRYQENRAYADRQQQLRRPPTPEAPADEPPPYTDDDLRGRW